MAVFTYPTPDEKPWPTLGPSLCDLLEDRAVFGPGSLKGQPYVVDDEVRALIYRLYEVYPRDHPRAGRRRFDHGVIQLRKGTRKTEIAGAIAFLELHPEAEIRTDGWKRTGSRWDPVGRPIHDPYIPMVAFTEDQADDLAYTVLYTMCSMGEDPHLFDIGLDRIIRLGPNGEADGVAKSVALSPDSTDGKKPTFQHFDESHRMVSPRHKEARSTMLENIPKRPLDEPWSLDTTTPYMPGENSVAEDMHKYAKQVAKEKRQAPLFFYYRYAPTRTDENLDDDAELQAAVVDASGPVVAGFSNIASIAERYRRPDTDRSYFERVWLGRIVVAHRQAFDVVKWAENAREREFPLKGAPISLGFDGSRWRDSTALIATEVESGWQWPIGIWTVDPEDPDDEIDEDEVDSAVYETFSRWSVTRMYGDPAQGWDTALARYAQRFGQKRVLEFYTDSRGTRKTADAVRAYMSAIKSGECTNSGDETFAEHIANARKKKLTWVDELGQPLYLIEKDRPEELMDASMGGLLSWKARLDSMRRGSGRSTNRRRGSPAGRIR